MGVEGKEEGMSKGRKEKGGEEKERKMEVQFHHLFSPRLTTVSDCFVIDCCGCSTFVAVTNADAVMLILIYSTHLIKATC